MNQKEFVFVYYWFSPKTFTRFAAIIIFHIVHDFSPKNILLFEIDCYLFIFQAYLIRNHGLFGENIIIGICVIPFFTSVLCIRFSKYSEEADEYFNPLHRSSLGNHVFHYLFQWNELQNYTSLKSYYTWTDHFRLIGAWNVLTIISLRRWRRIKYVRKYYTRDDVAIRSPLSVTSLF